MNWELGLKNKNLGIGGHNSIHNDIHSWQSKNKREIIHIGEGYLHKLTVNSETRVPAIIVSILQYNEGPGQHNNQIKNVNNKNGKKQLI